MSYLFFGLFGLPEEPTPVLSAEGSPTLSPAGVMYTILQQLCDHVETEKLEKTTLQQLVQRLQRDFALLLPQIELLDQPLKVTLLH